MTGLFNRVIPCLLLQNGGLVKTVRFQNPKYVGDPINAIRIFNEKCVDELIFLDIEASRLDKSPDYDLLSRIAGECFMPLCYGGGIKSIQQARRLISLGIEKISINTAAISNPGFVTSLVEEFGSQSIVGAINVKRNVFGNQLVYDSSTRHLTKLTPWDYAQRLAEEGVGEILVNDVNRDGTFSGYDTALVLDIAKQVNVPVIACGGAGRLSDMKKVFLAGASAAAAGSLFVFYGVHRAVLINYPDYKTVEGLFTPESA